MGKSKKYISVTMLVLCIVLILTACGKSDIDNNADKNTGTTEVSDAPTPDITDTAEITEAVKPTEVPEITEALKPSEAPDITEALKPSDAPDITDTELLIKISLPEGAPEDAVLLENNMISTDLYSFKLHEKFNNKTYYTISEDNSFSLFDFSHKELLKIVPKETIDEAWEALGDRYGYCLYAYDYVYVIILPEDYDPDKYVSEREIAVGDFDINIIGDDFKYKKDALTYNALKSIRFEHISKLAGPDEDYSYNDDTYFKTYGRFIFGWYSKLNICSWYSLSDYKLAVIYSHADDYTIDQAFLLDNDDIFSIDMPDYKEIYRYTVFPTDYNNDGIHEYIFIDNAHERDGHVVITEERSKDDPSALVKYDMDMQIIKDDIRKILSENIDTDSDKAVFYIDGKEMITVESEYELSDMQYELELYDILDEDEYGPYEIEIDKERVIGLLFWAKLPVDGRVDIYDYDYAPLIFANFIYTGKGNYKLTDLSIKKFGKSIKPLDLENREPVDGSNLSFNFNDPEYEIARFHILSIDDERNVILRPSYTWYNDSGFGGYLPIEPDVQMKIAEDCTIIYMPKELCMWEGVYITLSDLKYIVDNYHDEIRMSAIHHQSEYYYDFVCAYKDGVIYAMYEIYYA